MRRVLLNGHTPYFMTVNFLKSIDKPDFMEYNYIKNRRKSYVKLNYQILFKLPAQIHHV